MSKFKKGSGDWTQYRELENYREVELHFPKYDPITRERFQFWDIMGKVWETSFNAIKSAQEDGIDYVILKHGHSTSGRFKTTARSQVRNLMRSKEATPYIIRKNSIQHYSVFVAKIRPKE